MGSYRQHVGVAGFLGVTYAWGAFVLAGVHWLYGSVAALLTTLGGLLPDLDSDSGVELRGFSGILGVLAAVAVWTDLRGAYPELPFEVHLWATVVAYALVRHGLRRLMMRITVHRGILHSLPACAIWGAAAYLYYPSDRHAVRLLMAAGVMLGSLSHLLLDEACSVDLRGARVNRAFGTALKLWAPSALATIGAYALLYYLTYRVLQVWPDGPLIPVPRVAPEPRAWPPRLPDLGWLGASR